MNAVNPAYYGREQTKVKHAVLERYLTALALIVGQSFAADISFVDCCAGPWETKTDDLTDSSIGIAIQQLRNVRETLATKNKVISVRCLFIEKKPKAYAQLKKFCSTIADIPVKPLPGDFVQLIPEIKRFVAERRGSFPFFFIDPTGWLPLKIKPLTPLLQADGEVLINFMTSFIARFLEVDGKDFGELLSKQDMDRLRGLSGQDYEDEAAFAYARHIGRAGNFPFVCTTIVLNPQQRRTHYHLIYATRHHKGVEVFKATERRASNLMSYVRADAKERNRIAATGMDELFPLQEDEVINDQYIVMLRNRYSQRAHELVEQTLSMQRLRPVPYDQVWSVACHFPLVYESDLHQWIDDWKKQGEVEVRGLQPRERVPKCQAGHALVWRA